MTPVSGFDFFDRLAPGDRTTGVDLIFSNDPAFSSIVATQSYSPGAAWGYSQTFSPVSARYARLDATAAAGNPGMTEMTFYAVPETSAAVLAGLAGLLTVARRRR